MEDRCPSCGLLEPGVEHSANKPMLCPEKPVVPLPHLGPWCSESLDRWWAIAEHPDEAIAQVRKQDADIFPIYFAWQALIERVCIRWADEPSEEVQIVECMADHPRHIEAWRITVENR